MRACVYAYMYVCMYVYDFMYCIGSWLSWQVQTHTNLLQLSTSLFLACSLDSLHQAASEGKGWEGGTERVGVVRHSSTLLLHLMKLFNLFQHIIDDKDPEERDTKVSIHLRCTDLTYY